MSGQTWMDLSRAQAQQVSESRWTPKQLADRLALETHNLEHYEHMAQVTRERIKAIRDEMGTLPVGGK